MTADFEFPRVLLELEDLTAIRLAIARARVCGLEVGFLTLRADRLSTEVYGRPEMIMGVSVRWIEEGPDDVDIS